MPAKTTNSGRIKLTKAFIQDLEGTGKRVSYRDDTVPGLLLRVSPDAKSKVWYFDYRNQKGQRRMFRIGPINRFSLESAKREARKVAGTVADGADPARDKTALRESKVAAKGRTIRAYLRGKYWDHHLSHKRSGAATASRIESAWTPFLDEDMACLSRERLVDYRARRLKKGLKPTTLNRDRVALMALLNRAAEDGVISANPVIGFKRLMEEHDPRVRCLSPAERQRFMLALEDQPDYFQVLVRLALLSGMRRGELLQLTWPNADIRRQQVTVRAHTAKGAKTRVIPLPSAATDLLSDWKQQQEVTDLDRHVFLNPETGKPFQGIKRRWQELTSAAQIEDFRFHDCRHDYASRLVEAGVDLYRVKELLGHSSIEQTQRYAHLSDEAKRAAVEVLS